MDVYLCNRTQNTFILTKIENVCMRLTNDSCFQQNSIIILYAGEKHRPIRNIYCVYYQYNTQGNNSNEIDYYAREMYIAFYDTYLLSVQFLVCFYL